MKFGYMCAAAALAMGLGTTAAAQQSAAVGTTPVPTGDDVTITGCVVKGDDGYVLTAVGEAVTVQSSRTAVGTSGTTTTTTTTTTTPATPVIPPSNQRYIYWLDDDDDLLEEHAGRRVEVRGDIEGDIERGEISVEREENMIELEIKAKGETITVKLPDTRATNATAVGTSGMVTDDEKDFPFKVRKFDVESVKVIEGNCL